MFWSSWVIEYSASQQLFLARKLSREFGWMQPGFFPRGQHHRLSRSQVLAVAAIPVALVVAFALRKLPRRRAVASGPRRGQRGEAPIFRVYQKTLDRLAARGLARRPEETPHEYLARVRQQGVVAADALAHLTDCYAEARYGDIEVPPNRLADARRSRVHRPRHIVLLAVTVVFLSTPRSHFDTNRSQQMSCQIGVTTSSKAPVDAARRPGRAVGPRSTLRPCGTSAWTGRHDRCRKQSYPWFFVADCLWPCLA